MHNGVPWDVAMGMDDTLRAACAITFSEFQGAKFNRHTMQFETS